MIEKYLIPNAYHLVFVNGNFSLPHSVEAKNFINVTDKNVINFPDNFQENIIFQLLFYTTEKIEKINFINTILVGKNSKVTLIETYVGNTIQYENNINIRMIIDCGAKIDYYKYQKESENATHNANITVEQRADSLLQAFNFCYGGQLSNDNLIIHLQEKNATCRLYGLYHAIKNQQISHCIHIEHHTTQGQSEQLYKGILDESSVGDFSGKIVVQPQAQKTQARQKNHNLLLSKLATANTKPELAIFADDVQCAHGATVGQLDDAALFYLRSRGIEEADAKQLLVKAFAADIINSIPNDNIRAYLYGASDG